jgi:hypothetical protein
VALATIRLLKQPMRSCNAIVGLRDGADIMAAMIHVRFSNRPVGIKRT